MYDERPSTKRILVTLAAWIVGIVAVFGLIFAISYAIAPRTPPVSAPSGAETSAGLIPSATIAPAGSVIPSGSTSQPVLVPPAPSATPSGAATNTPGRLDGKVVVIDAGHQAKADTSKEPIGPGSTTLRAKVAAGTTGYKTGVKESVVDLAVALKLRDALRARGATVVMVRTTEDVNIANSKRVKIANRARADLFVRLHCDGATEHSVSGITTLVPSVTNVADTTIVQPSREAALVIQRAIIESTGAKDRGVSNRDDLSGFNWATVPSVLVEMGFLTNAKEEAKLVSSTYQNAVADGLARGITLYLSRP